MHPNIFVIFLYTIFFSLLCSGSLASTIPENMRFRLLMQDSDVSVGEVLAFEHDKYGFMWIGGKLGLARYDGSAFKIYRHDQKQPFSIPSDTINDIVTDERGQLWIATNAGLCRFGYEDDTFHCHKHDSSSEKSLSSDIIYKIRFDRHGKMWLTTREGLDLYNPFDNSITRYPRKQDNPLLYTAYTMDIAQDTEGYYYVATGYGLKVWNPATNEIKYYQADRTKENTLPVDLIRAITVDSRDRVWAATEKGLVQFERKTERFTFYRTDIDPPGTTRGVSTWDVIEDKDGTIWVATDGNGIGYVNENKRVIVTSRHHPTYADSISSNITRRVYQDKLNDLWVGTYPMGVNVFERYSSAFRLFRKHSDKGEGLSEDKVRAFYEFKDGRLWIGTDGGGINYIDPVTEKFETIAHDPGNPSSLASDDIISIEEDHKGHIWVAKWKTALSVLEPETGRFRHYDNNPNDPTSISNTHTWDILSTTDGSLWVATIGSGLNKYFPETDNFKSYIHNANNASSVADDLIWALVEDKNGTLWIGTEKGLSRYNKLTDNFTSFLHNPSDSSSLSSNRVLCLYVDDKNVLWIGTHGGGLNRYDGKDFTAITKEDGLISNVINAIVEDNNGTLWLSSDKGISNYNPKNQEVHTYTKHDGVQDGTFNIGAGIKTQDGDILFGGHHGITRFNPNSISHNEYVPPVYITELKVEDVIQDSNAPNSVLSKNIFLTEKISLKHSQNLFTISFAALNFRNPLKNQYAYKLEGFDDSWHYVNNETKATYTNLNPGTYTFRVKAANNDGLWNEKGNALIIEVVPPLWRSWWAYSIYAILVAGIIAGYFASLKQTNRRLELEVQNRTKALTLANEKLEDLIVSDALTGLGNRRLLEKVIETESASSLRKYQAWLSYGQASPPNDADIVFYMVDIDNFKGINDKYGHAAGDKLLVEFAEQLKKLSRDSDYVIRWGGEEFIIICRHLSRYKANILAERVRYTIAHTFFELGEDAVVQITCSIGFACLPFNIESPQHYSWENTIDIADIALYASKQSGKDCWVGLLGTDEKAYTSNEIREHARQNRIRVESSLNGLSNIKW